MDARYAISFYRYHLYEMSEVANPCPLRSKTPFFCAKLMAQIRGTTLTADLVKEGLDELAAQEDDV